jgi:NAD-dependent deacetylase
MQELDRAAEILAGARRLVVTTGAGMSKESGIPTFREGPNALWANYDQEDLATPEGFLRNPPLVWKWYAERRKLMAEVSPHAGHIAIAEMEPLYSEFILLTQNIDNLHRQAGSKNIVELHGNIYRYKCFDNHHPVSSVPDTDEAPPRCVCGSYLRPDVVWFGEPLDRDNLDRAFTALEACDVILVVGTSGIVYPAAGFPALAKRAGARVVEVNPEITAVTPDADVFVQARAGEVLPALVSRMLARRAARKSPDQGA